MTKTVLTAIAMRAMAATTANAQSSRVPDLSHHGSSATMVTPRRVAAADSRAGRDQEALGKIAKVRNLLTH